MKNIAVLFVIFLVFAVIFYGFNFAAATNPTVTDVEGVFDSMEKTTSTYEHATKTPYPNGTIIVTYDPLDEKLTIYPNGTKILFHMTLAGNYENVIKYPNDTYSFQAGGRNTWDKLYPNVDTYYPDGKFRRTHIDSGEVDTDYPEPYVYGGSSSVSNTLKSTHSFQNGTKISEFWNGTSIVEQPQIHQTSQIPSWIKNTAKYWSDGSLTDKEFATGIGYMVQKKIISTKIATNKDGTILVNDNLSIPKWIKNNAKYWSEGSISDADFTSGIEYMVNQNIISFSEPSILSQISAPDAVVKTPTSTGQSKTVSAIQIQSKHGSYRPDTGTHGGFAIGGDSNPTKYYALLPTWVLKSQNGIEFNNAHIRLTYSDGHTKEFDWAIVDGVIQVVLSGKVAGTYVFEITSIDGNPPPTGSRIEIMIPNENTPGTPSTVQATPSVTSTPLTQTPLSFNVPSQVVQEATSNSGAIVSFTTSFSSPGAGSNQIITCNPTSGSLFPLGNTVVTCTGTDLSSQNTLKKSFTVIVQDTTPPAISPFQPHNDTPDDSGAVVYFTASAIDLVDGPVIPHCNYESGMKFPMGVSTITCTADDSRGNHASRSLQIIITKS